MSSTFRGLWGRASGKLAADEFQHRKDKASNSCMLLGSETSQNPLGRRSKHGSRRINANLSAHCTPVGRGTSRKDGKVMEEEEEGLQQAMLLPAAKPSSEMQEQGVKGGKALGLWDEEGPEELWRKY